MVEFSRKTNETSIQLSLNIYGEKNINVKTGIGFFDHMITSMAFWAGWDLTLRCQGDLEIDTHHTVEDVGLSLGKAFHTMWFKHQNIVRIAHAFCPLDDALTRVVVDVCNRPYSTFDATFNVEKVGAFETAMTGHFFRSFAQEGRITQHIRVLHGHNAHHMIETIFKGLGLALKRACTLTDVGTQSTKGYL
ncbi:MAG: imidazoleglycerol-phosphate dehydratase HisB [Fidelibacterota bacterium]